jgi:hypothetical protein
MDKDHHVGVMGSLPDLSSLRASVKLWGRALSEEIAEGRRNSRY